jgi:signal transduction protein with GAF and PtsI domain
MPAVKKAYYQSMHELLNDLDSAQSPQKVCCSIVEDVTKATCSKGCSLMLFTSDKKALLHSASFGLSDWFVKKGPVMADESISQTLSGTPVAVLDAPSDARIGYRKQIQQEGIASILNVPVTLKENVIGVMRIYTSEQHQFTSDDISFASAAANFGAAALEEIGFYESIQKDYETFRNSMRQMRSELGNELNSEPDVEMAEDKGPMIPPGG